MKNILKRSLVATSALAMALLSFSAGNVQAAPYGLSEEKLASTISISGDKVENNLVVFDESLDTYKVNVTSSLDISSLWKYSDYYYDFDPTVAKEGSLTTEVRGDFDVKLNLDSKFKLDESKDLKESIENNITTDVDGGVKGKGSVFFNYFVVNSAKVEGNVVNISLSYKDGITGKYLLDTKNARPNLISVSLSDYVSLEKTKVNTGDKLAISSDYQGVIIMDTDDKYEVSLQNKINEVRKGVTSVVANSYFPVDATSTVTELHLPVSSSTSDEIEFVSKSSAKRLVAAAKSVLPNTGLTNYSYTLLASVLLISAVLIYRRKSIKK